jgi:hypothetical protein
MKEYTLPEFIEQLLIPDLERMEAQQLHYYAFSIVCQAIEVMGAATDNSSLEDFSLSERRFTNALATFFKDRRYANNQSKFFKMLRGPLIHQLRPGDGFLLASEAKDNINPAKHLEGHESGATLLIFESFLEDFKQAFRRFKQYLTDKKASALERFQSTFLVVTPLAPAYGKTFWNRNLSGMVTLTASVTRSATFTSEFDAAVGVNEPPRYPYR